MPGEPATFIARTLPPEPTVDDSSLVLFRLGERCNHACPMCTNTGRPDLELHTLVELERRLERLHARGFRRVMLTGGEPTIHPDFFSVIDALRAREMTWDLNTHGRSFHRIDFAIRARTAGLRRAIVSLHGHDAATSGAMSGAPRGAFEQTLRGIGHLVEQGVEVMANLVLSRFNLAHLNDWLTLLQTEFGTAVVAKICMPSLESQGREWAPIALRMEELSGPLRNVRDTAQSLGLRLVWESVPNCITGDPTHGNIGRLGFGETHYLEDTRGEELISIARIEAATTRFHPDCARCVAFDRCSGVSAPYAERFGVNALVPFPRRPGSWWL